MNLVAGSTGLLGNDILQELGLRERPTIALGRRSVANLPECAKELILDFENIPSWDLNGVDHVYLSLGYPLYYQNVMGFMSANLKKDFFLVDFTYQLEIAKRAREAGAQSVSLISSVGSNPDSKNFYLQTKGKLEAEIVNLGFKSTNIFHPGHLRGNKSRLDILIADAISVLSDPFLIGSLKKFRSISSKKVARCVVDNSLEPKAGTNHFYFSDFK